MIVIYFIIAVVVVDDDEGVNFKPFVSATLKFNVRTQFVRNFSLSILLFATTASPQKQKSISD